MYQKIQIIGRLGRDPEMKYSPSGQAVTSFSVATDNQYTDKDGKKVKETTWFRVQVWGKMAEHCNTYLAKGSLVMVEGRMVGDKTTGAPKVYQKQDGSYAATFEINAQNVKFLSTKEKAEQPAQVDEEMPF